MTRALSPMDPASDPHGGAAATQRDLAERITIPDLSPEQVAKARLYVCGRARDAADAALILAALGIGEES